MATVQCLCAAVSLQIEHLSHSVGACHCSMCQRWGGSAFMAVDAGDSVSITGEQNVTRYQSSEWAERAFCKRCGTHLFYRLKQNNQHILSLGILEDKAGLEFDHQIFIEERCPVYSFANKTKEMTGEEVFAAFAGDSE